MLNFVVNSTIIPFVHKVYDLTNFIGEKLVNIFGEIKNFNARKIVENLYKKAKKIMSLCLYTIEYENYKNDEVLAIFQNRELKKFGLNKNIILVIE